MIDAGPDHSCIGLYRAYTLNSAGWIILVEIIRAVDDAEACADARAMAQDCTIKLWDRARLLRQFTSGQRTTPLVGDLAA